MNDYIRVLDSAEKHLEELKASGVRFLTVEQNTLTLLAEAPDSTAVATEVVMPNGRPIETPEAVTQEAMPTPGNMDELRERAHACRNVSIW
jgi:hypothetical protein